MISKRSKFSKRSKVNKRSKFNKRSKQIRVHRHKRINSRRRIKKRNNKTYRLYGGRNHDNGYLQIMPNSVDNGYLEIMPNSVEMYAKSNNLSMSPLPKSPDKKQRRLLKKKKKKQRRLLKQKKKESDKSAREYAKSANECKSAADAAYTSHHDGVDNPEWVHFHGDCMARKVCDRSENPEPKKTTICAPIEKDSDIDSDSDEESCHEIEVENEDWHTWNNICIARDHVEKLYRVKDNTPNDEEILKICRGVFLQIVTQYIHKHGYPRQVRLALLERVAPQLYWPTKYWNANIDWFSNLVETQMDTWQDVINNQKKTYGTDFEIRFKEYINNIVTEFNRIYSNHSHVWQSPRYLV